MTKKNPGLAKPGVTHNREDRPASDFYPTPPNITAALFERELFPTGIVWEPACGAGDMTQVIEAHGYEVKSSDLFDHGFGEPGVDFTAATELPAGVASVVTNPPFKVAEAFIHTCLRLKVPKFAMFQRLAFLEGKGRYQNVFRDHPPSRVWVFSGRVTLVPSNGGKNRGTGGFMAFAWYVWDSAELGKTELGWIAP